MPLPAGTTRAAIAIGVDRTGGLEPLAAAAKGALEVETWFKDEGYQVTPLVDSDNHKVKVGDIFDAVSMALETVTLTTLVIYFAGHGYFSVGSEIWLLSGAGDNPGEAVNLGESTVAARRCGLANVVFVADTCRSVPQTLQANAVKGSSIFPIRTATVETQIDTFFATNPGDVAVEVALDAARKNYDGLFTKALRGLHERAPKEELVVLNHGGHDISVLPNRRLRRLVPDFFVREARAIGAVISQTPSLRIESDEPFFVASAKAAPAITNRGGAALVDPEPRALGAGNARNMARAARNLIAKAELQPPPPIRDPGADPDELRLTKEALAQRDAETHGGSETQCCVVISGGSIIAGLCLGGPWGSVDNSGSADNLFRVHNAQHDWSPCTTPGSAVLRFNDGRGTVVATIPGYVVSLILKDGGLIGVSYTPAPGSARRHEYEYFKDQAEERRAIAATTARHGLLAMDREDAAKFADFIRVGKDIDPTLGIYAALAYANVGLGKDAVSVMRYMQESLSANLLDVWLLAGADPAERVRQPLVPVCPMLSQAWDYLRPNKVEIPAVLAAAARHQSLWTTFQPEAMDAIWAAEQAGELG